MKQTKRQFKMFSFFDFDGIAAHMEKMAADGWMLEQSTNRYWHYRKTEPKKVKFAVTYFPKTSEFDPYPTEELQAFKEFCETAGWKPAASVAQMQIFYNENENPLPLETDPVVQVNTIHSAMKKNYIPSLLIMALLPLWVIGVYIMKMFTNPVDSLSSNSDMYIIITYILLLITSASELVQYYSWRKKALALASEGRSIPSGKTAKQFQIVIVGVMSVLFIIYAVSMLGVVSPWFMLVLFGIFGSSGALSLWVKEFLRRRNVPRKLNVAITVGSVFVVIMAVLVGFVTAVIKYDLPISPKQSQPVGSYITEHGYELDIYDDAVPLRVEDFVATDYKDYSVRNRKSQSILLAKYEISQDATVNRQNVPEIIYDVVEVKRGWLYDWCFEKIFDDIDETDQTDLPYEYRYTLIEQNDSAWLADKVYRVQYEGQYLDKWLICWGDKIVEMKFYNCDQLTDSQKTVIGQKIKEM